MLLGFQVQSSHCSLQRRILRAKAATAGMNRIGGAIALAVILWAAAVQGFVMFKAGRCHCIGPGATAVKMAAIEKVSVIHPSNGCDKIEVIVTLKAHKGQRCLDPRSKQARFIMQTIEKKKILRHQNM